MILVLNAPPACGKDTIAELLRDNHKFAITTFKHSMFDIACALSGLSKCEFMARFNDRQLKEVPWDKLAGKSCREFFIHISEDIMKPLYGRDVFGKRAAENCLFAHSSGFPDVVFADGGFEEEVLALHEEGLKVAVVRLHRDGYSFNKDSRNYLYPEFCPSTDIVLKDGDPEDAVKQILAFKESFNSED